MKIQRIVATALAGAASLALLATQAYAVTPEAEAAPEVGIVGKIIFAVLFFGFCGGVVWMMAKQKNEEDGKDKGK